MSKFWRHLWNWLFYRRVTVTVRLDQFTLFSPDEILDRIVMEYLKCGKTVIVTKNDDGTATIETFEKI